MSMQPSSVVTIHHKYEIYPRRNTLQSLCDHSEWCIWNRALTGGWRLREQEWKLPHPNPTQQSLKSLPCLHGGWFILQSGKLLSITYNSRAACKALTLQTQMLQPHMPLPGVHQLQWWEPCETQCMMQSTFQCQYQKSNPQGNRCFFFSIPQLVTLHHTNQGPVSHWCMGWYYHLLWRTFPNNAIRW